MARRVNTKFVVVLVATLGGVGSIIVGLMVYIYLRNHNPDALKARAENEEKSGKFEAAVRSFASAADLSSRRHRPGADAIYAHAADLSLNISKNAKTEEDAIVYYRTAIELYNRAQASNPRNREVSQKLLEESFQDGFWKSVEDQATKMIAIEDGGKARVYRAQARLANLRVGTGSSLEATPEKDFKAIEDDLAAALKFDPSSGLATALTSQLELTRKRIEAMSQGLTQGSVEQNIISMEAQRSVVAARLAAADPSIHLDSTTQPQKSQAFIVAAAAAEMYLGEVEKERKRLNDYLEKQGADIDVALTLANICRQQYLMLHKNDVVAKLESPEMIDLLEKAGRKELENGVVVLEKTLAKSPSNTRIGEELGQFYDVSDPGKTERLELLYKKMIAADPDVLANHMLLASYYRAQGSTASAASAVNTYKEMLNHENFGTGGETLRNSALRLNAIESIVWLDMDLASAADGGITSEKGKAYMKEASDYTNRLRSHISRGRVYLLDGRVQLLNHNIAEAMTLLRQALANLNGDPGAQFQLRQTKILLAACNEQQQQFGPAVTLLSEVVTGDLARQYSDPQLRWKLASLQAQSGGLAEAQAGMQSSYMLGEPLRDKDGMFTGSFSDEDGLSASMRDRAKRLWSAATASLGNTKDAEIVLRKLASSADDKGSIRQWMLTQLTSGENEAAAADALNVLEKADSNQADLNILAYEVAVTAKSRMGEKEDARKLAAEALAKYPNDISLKILAEQTNSPDGQVSDEAQRKILDSIPDELARLDQLARFYHSRSADKEITTLLELEKKLAEKPDQPQARDALNGIVDRIFSAAVVAAVQADAAKAPQYWNTAQTYQQKAEKLNLDGVGGKLYAGRMLLAKSGGKEGLSQVQAAVAQRPDYAYGHMILAQAYMSQRNQTAALKEFQAVIQLSPNNIMALQSAIPLLVPRGDVAAADPGNLREAQNYVAMGLRVAPHNVLFEDFRDVLLTSALEVGHAIQVREQKYVRDPSNIRNIRWLAALYQRQWSTLTPEQQRATPNPAVALLRKEVDKHPDDLDLVDNLARLLVDSAQPEEIQKLYAPFINNSDKNVRYDALVASAEFWRHAGMTDVAINALEEAIKVQPPQADEAQRHLADMYFDLGGDENMAKAEQEYQRVVNGIQDVDARDKVMRRLIEAQLRQSKFKEALPQLDSMLVRLESNYKQHPDYPETKHNLIQGIVLRGFASVQQQKLSDALKDLNRALTYDDGNPDALYYRSIVHATQSDQFIAKWDFEKAQEEMNGASKDLIAARARDRTPNSRLLLAQIYRRTQHYGEASIVYAEIIDKWPERLDVRVEYTDFLMSLATEQLSEPADSHEDLVRLLRELNPVDKLFAQLKDAQQRFPRQLRWPLLFADLLTVRGNNAEAFLYYEDLFKKMPGEAQIVDAYLGGLLKKKDYASVVSIVSTMAGQSDALGQFIKRNPKFVSFYIKRMEAYQNLQKQPEALADLDHAFEIGVQVSKAGNPDPFITVLAEGNRIFSPQLVADRLGARVAADPSEVISRIGQLQSLLLLNKPEEALKAANEIKLPDKDPGLRGLALREIALARYQAKKYPEASADFAELWKISPDDVESLNNYAFMLAEGMKQPKQGIVFAERALQVLALKSDVSRVSLRTASVYDTLGWAKCLDGQVDPAAITDLKRAINLQPMAATYLHLATAYLKVKMQNEARKAVEDGLKLEQKSPDESLAELNKLQEQLRQMP